MTTGGRHVTPQGKALRGCAEPCRSSRRVGVRSAVDANSDTVSYSRIVMPALTKVARSILDRLEPERTYEVLDLRIFMPDAGAETLREIMQELWINRQVERVGDSGWRRHLSAPPHQRPEDARDIASVSGFGPTQVVKPEDLFDHDSFAEFFR